MTQRKKNSYVINIFGVGRSATKSCLIQSIYAANRLGRSCWVNYEPYYWQNARAARASYYSLKAHETTPLICLQNERYRAHDVLLRNISDSDEDVTINKFIRGLGRVPRIKAVTSPDLNILVIRGLYDQMSSIFAARWDLVGQGLEHTSDRDRFIEEAAGIKANKIPDIEFLVSRLKNRLDVNCLYWYVMNWLAIDELDQSDTLCVYEKYSPLKNVGEFVYERLGGEDPLDGFGEYVQGHEIHNPSSFFHDEKIDLVNNFNLAVARVFRTNRYALRGGKVGGRVDPMLPPAGSYLSSSAYSEYGGIGKVSIKNNEVYEVMIANIDEKISSKFYGVYS